MTAQLEEEVDLFEGDMVTILEKVDKNYFRGTSRGQTGIFPCAFVTLVDSGQAAAAASLEMPKSKSAQLLEKYQPIPAPQAMPPAIPSRLKITVKVFITKGPNFIILALVSVNLQTMTLCSALKLLTEPEG